MALWARLKDRRGGPDILFVNTHFDHVGRTARLESARLLRAFIAQRRRPGDIVVLLGDFNAAPSEDAIGEIVAPGAGALKSARDASETPPFGPPGTFTAFDVRRADPAPIDHIFTDPEMRVLRYGVLTHQNAGRLPSDHYPVLADLAAH